MRSGGQFGCPIPCRRRRYLAAIVRNSLNDASSKLVVRISAGERRQYQTTLAFRTEPPFRGQRGWRGKVSCYILLPHGLIRPLPKNV